MRRLFCTVCDDRFAPGCRVMLHSMQQRLRCFAGADVTVFYDRAMSSLSPASQRAIAAVVPRVRFESVSSDTYSQAKVAVEHHRPALLTLEAFRQEGYDQVVFFDGDMLTVNDWSDALDRAADFDLVACEAGVAGPDGRWAEVEGPIGRGWGRRKWGGLLGRRRHKINTGLFVLGPRLRTPAVYERLHRTVRNRRTSERRAVMLDQWAINEALGDGDSSLLLLPNAYNLRALDRYAGEYRSKVCVLHYAGYHQRPKPWEAGAPFEHPAYADWVLAAADLERAGTIDQTHGERAYKRTA